MTSQRRDYRWEKLRAQLKARYRASGAPCHLCVARGDIEQSQIDYSAPRFAPNGFELDHIKPWRLYPHLRYEPANCKPAHSRCNRQRRDEAMQTTTSSAAGRWIVPDW